MSRFLPAVAFFLLSASSLANAAITTLTCTTSAVPLMMRAEGITEPAGELVIDCSGGQPSGQLVESVTLQLNLEITNRIDTHNNTDALFTADSGSGPVPVNPAGVLTSPHTVTWSGVHLTLSPAGAIALRFSNIRVNATEAVPSPGGQILADLVVGGDVLEVNQSSLVLGSTFTSLYSNFSSSLVCAQAGAKVPDGLSFAQFIAAHAAFNTTRVTEGFPSALESKLNAQSYGADTGDRILVHYTGLSPQASLYVPAAVAGSDAIVPTAGGDFGLEASGGVYASSTTGESLLLTLVSGADAHGVGGWPLFYPPAPGAGGVSLDALEQLAVAADGSATAVYEVMDSSDSTQETAQFPTFLAVPPSGSGVTYVSSEQVLLAPISTVTAASVTAPVPRFVQTVATNDCTIVGDCSAIYFPHLLVTPSSLEFTETAGIATSQILNIRNTGEGSMAWTSTVYYQTGSGSGWLTLSPSSWSAPSGVTVLADSTGMAPGTWSATILIDAGPFAGHVPIVVTLKVSPPAGPSIASVHSAANSDGPITPGSLATILGTSFMPPVTVTFDGLPARVLISNHQEIHVLVPPALAGRPSTEMVLSLNGAALAPVSVPVVLFSPGIFPGEVWNQDHTRNGSAHPASPGALVEVFGTGMSRAGVVTARMAGQPLIPEDSGPSPRSPGVQQVSLRVPAGTTPGNYFLQLCEAAGVSTPVCSPAVWLVVGR